MAHRGHPRARAPARPEADSVLNVLGIIPARGGSKAIPRKNLATLGGRPLIAYTIDAARSSRRLTRVVVSTDSDEIASSARTLGAEVPFLRSAELARDETPMLDVVVDVVHTFASHEQYSPDILVLLQPTSPFRRAEHIDAAVDLLVRSGADSVVTVVQLPHQFNPASLFTLDDDRLARWDAQGAAAPTRRQDKPRLFARNGPAVIAVRTGVVMQQGGLYGSDMRALVMSREDSIDIDDQYDLELAELLLTRAAARSRG